MSVEKLAIIMVGIFTITAIASLTITKIYRPSIDGDGLSYIQENTECIEGHMGMCFCYLANQNSTTFTSMSCDDAYNVNLKIRRK